MTRAVELWAEFSAVEDLVTAARALRDQGNPPLDAFTPYPVPELDRALELERPIVLSYLTFVGACTGGALAYLVIWWTAAVDYPLNVGGRPLNSVVADIPILFESSVLGAAVTAFFGFLFGSGLPRLTHALDGDAGFRDTTRDRFLLAVRATGHETATLTSKLRELGALRTWAQQGRDP